MPRKTKKTTTKSIGRSRKTQRRKTTDRRKNIVGNFRGAEDIFWTKVVNGFKKLLSPAFPKK